jgi:hypothetical protein
MKIPTNVDERGIHRILEDHISMATVKLIRDSEKLLGMKLGDEAGENAAHALVSGMFAKESTRTHARIMTLAGANMVNCKVEFLEGLVDDFDKGIIDAE